jgi:Zn-dependent peptidase ImmA (M78 family)
MPARTQITITPAVLKWAIAESGYADQEVADGIHVPVEILREWMQGVSKPSKAKVEALAAKLKRPSALFLLPEEPHSAVPKVQFRRPAGSSRTKPNPKELRWLREAARVQETLAWAVRELGEAPAQLPLVRPNSPVESTAIDLYSLLTVTGISPPAAPTDSQIQSLWRERLGSLGVFVFLLPLGADSIRGFSLYDDVAPVIAVNTKWSYRPRVFSMLHEFVHLVSRTSSACVETSFSQRHLPHEDDRVERWCEEVASAILMPWELVTVYIRDHLRNARRVESLEQLYKVANHFKTSARATALRLIGRDVASWALYNQIPKANEEKRSGGGASGGRNREEIREDEYGQRTIRVFAAAVENELLTSTDAAGYLKISDIDLGAWR